MNLLNYLLVHWLWACIVVVSPKTGHGGRKGSRTEIDASSLSFAEGQFLRVEVIRRSAAPQGGGAAVVDFAPPLLCDVRADRSVVAVENRGCRHLVSRSSSSEGAVVCLRSSSLFSFDGVVVVVGKKKGPRFRGCPGQGRRGRTGGGKTSNTEVGAREAKQGARGEGMEVWHRSTPAFLLP